MEKNVNVLVSSINILLYYKNILLYYIIINLSKPTTSLLKLHKKHRGVYTKTLSAYTNQTQPNQKGDLQCAQHSH